MKLLDKIFGEKQHGHSHDEHSHDHEEGKPGHTHGMVDPSLATSQRGIWALKWSFVGLMVTALFQLVIVFFTGSVALLADTIHNFGDAATAVPLWIAFLFGQKKPNKKFNYGYGKVEDVAGVIIILLMVFSAIVASYEAINRLIHPQPITHIWIVIVASIIGFLGNEAVAIFRIRVGKEINSAALIADGYHARTDGFTSLAVLVGAIGVLLGFPLADPIVGLLIVLAILKVAWESGKSVFTRLLDGVEPDVVEEIKHAVEHTKGVIEISDTRIRWIGHKLHAELNIAVDPALSTEQAHEIVKEAEHNLKDHIPHLMYLSIHIDPKNASGEKYHHLDEDVSVHAHGA